MFKLAESSRRGVILPWILHYLIAVFAPLLSMGWIAGMLSATCSADWRSLLLTYSFLSVTALLLGTAAAATDPRTANVARKVWILPVSILSIAVCWDLYISGFNWRSIIVGYIIFIPGDQAGDEPWDNYFLFTFPAVTSLAYRLGSKLYERFDLRRNNI